MKKPSSIKDLIASQGVKLRALKDGAQAADRVLSTVRECLPQDCSGSVWAASQKDGQLTIMVGDPSDATRLHYALPGLQAALAGRLPEPLSKITLRVRPAPPDPA